MSYKATQPGERGRVTDIYAAEEVNQLGAISLATSAGRVIPSFQPTRLEPRPRPTTTEPVRRISISPTPPVDLEPGFVPPSSSLPVAKATAAVYDRSKIIGEVVTHPESGEPVVPVMPKIPVKVATSVQTAKAPASSTASTPKPPDIKTAPPPAFDPVPLYEPSAPASGLSTGVKIGLVAALGLGIGIWLWSRR